MRYLVLGAGALGGYFGSMLIRGGADVTFLVRPARATQLRRDGLIVKTQDGDELRTQVKVVQRGQLDGSYDVVLLCCKAYDLDPAMDAIAPAMSSGSAIVPLLNGVRHIDVLKEKFGPERVLGCLTIINAALMADGSIQQSQLRINLTAIGELDGRLSSRCTAIKTALEAGGIPVQISESILVLMWEKFFGFTCNAAIASLTRSRAGAIAQAAEGASFVSAVIDECTRVVTALGHPPLPAFNSAAQISGLFSQASSTYGPSMLIDMEDGRPTEGEHTIGDLVERAAQASVSAPLLTAARCNLQTYEINRGGSK
ncbi:ketopantoate reductase family protein [Bradyrhizobium jicamae]|uniref:ketopantoate reductase family protein n=1 Tax=Bradyrhizobium jicamae TaxID=280332 RepID=UPI001BA9F1D1|nr:ketopantoate reductase family protein [Bradyrhizobium jicamae]MBR0931853.1 ketopantoate reductase family protein [Bradyrhizobium jicamae]